ncbi:MAG: hypothetical protein HQ559_18420 [Lentisphaerae bacterium]|nr:hypothetical protein [Lentisphaerota bacterium]
MQALVTKLKQQAVRSGLAVDVQLRPLGRGARSNIVVDLKPREAPADPKVPTTHPMDAVKALLAEVGLEYVNISYFPSVDGSAVIVEVDTSPKAKEANAPAAKPADADK